MFLLVSSCKVILLAVALHVLMDMIDSHSHARNRNSLPQPTAALMPTNFTCVERGPSDGKVCRFVHLCYSHHLKNFVALRDDENEMGCPIGDLKLDLTAIVNFDQKMFRCAEVPLSAVRQKKLRVRNMSGKHVIFGRLVSGNLGHLFQDELIPLFQTLREEGELQNRDTLKLILFDEHDLGCCPELYDAFSASPPLKISDLSPLSEPKNSLTCFEDAIVGLSKETVWYQYLPGSPERPFLNSTATAEHIYAFTDFLRGRLGIYPNCYGENVGILFRRQKNRRIINDEELATAISEHYGIKMEILDLEDFPLSYLIEKASCAKLMAGVHGALLMLSLFLPPKSVVLEIFPYALNPDYMSHYRTLASLPGMTLEYTRWRNYDRSRTIEHPQAPLYSGGISHLSEMERGAIMASTEVSGLKPVFHPEWRFRMYQDTIADITSILQLLNVTNLSDNIREESEKGFGSSVLSVFLKVKKMALKAMYPGPYQRRPPQQRDIRTNLVF